MSDNENRAVQHDGVRNFLGGRNMMPNSASPAMAVSLTAATQYAGLARANITVLYEYSSVDFAQADMVVLDE